MGRDLRYCGLNDSDGCNLLTSLISLLWISSCCSFMPFIAIIKAAICIIPCTLFVVFGTTLTSIILIPHDFYYTYYTILATKKIGPNLKILSCLLLPPCVIVFPFVVFISSVFTAIGGCSLAPFYYTFNTEYNYFFGGIGKCFKGAWNIVKWFWEMNSNSYFVYLEGIRTGDGEQFDIKLIQVPFCLLIGLMCSLLLWVLVFLNIFLKYPIMLVYFYYYIFKWTWKGIKNGVMTAWEYITCKDCDCNDISPVAVMIAFPVGFLVVILSPFAIVLWILLVVGLPIWTVVVALGFSMIGIVWGLAGAYNAYRTSFCFMLIDPFLFVLKSLYWFDYYTNSWFLRIYSCYEDRDEGCSLVPCFKEGGLMDRVTELV